MRLLQNPAATMAAPRNFASGAQCRHLGRAGLCPGRNCGSFATTSRSKRDRKDWSYYLDAEHNEERKRDLFFEDRFLDLESDTLTKDRSMAMSFVQAAHDRMIAMYEEWRKSVLEYL